jgi:hypothetical protein
MKHVFIIMIIGFLLISCGEKKKEPLDIDSKKLDNIRYKLTMAIAELNEIENRLRQRDTLGNKLKPKWYYGLTPEQSTDTITAHINKLYEKTK